MNTLFAHILNKKNLGLLNEIILSHPVNNLSDSLSSLNPQSDQVNNRFSPRRYNPYTVVILINATTFMHRSTLSTNNFGNNHFGQKYQKENILRIFRL